MNYERILKNLKARRFDAYAVKTAEEAKKLALSFIKPENTVAVGGSMTLSEIGLLDELRKEGVCRFLDRYAKLPPEELAVIRKESLSADVLLASVNAITEEGIIFQTDGTGTRVAPMIYGAGIVLLLVGKNKIVPDSPAAIERIRAIAAPLNTKRLNRNTPCRQTGHCMDCLSPDCICANRVEMRFCASPGRIKVILIDEEYGY